MAHSPYETRLQGIMVDVIIKITIQSKIMNPCSLSIPFFVNQGK